MNNEPLVKMVFVPKGQVKLYFPKRNYPREIGYNAVVFPETENICVLKSVHVLTQYPMAEAIYNELLLGCRGKVR